MSDDSNRQQGHRHILHKIKKSFVTDSVFLGNEYKTNLFVAKIMAVLTGILMISWVFNELDIFAVEKSIMRQVAIQGFFELMIPFVICYALKGSKKWIKYIMMIEFTVVLARIDGMLTYSVAVAMFIPVVLSCCYYSGAFTVQISVLSAILFAVSSFISAYMGLGVQDLNYAGADTAEYVKNIMTQSFASRLMLFILVSVACVTIARRCRKLVLDQHGISREQSRVETELVLASRIQTHELPDISDLPRQDIKTFDMAASMNPAKQVGGDFYDFFYLDPKHLALMIADVSGKGVPAALYMMVSKILLDNGFDSDLSPGKVLSEVNHQLCEKQLEDMFVTVWLGVINLETGEMVTANAGHENPIIAKAGGDFEVFKDRHGLVLGGLSGVRYKESRLTLEPGDTLFVYTDGIIEANNNEQKQYGMERTLHALNECKGMSMAGLLDHMKTDIENFSAGAPQFDDITMLAFRFDKNLVSEGITVKPSMESFPQVMAYVEGELEKSGLDIRKQHKFNIVVDELLANIVNYSGAEWVQVIVKYDDNKVQLYIRDNGMPYNPLEAKDPDITAPAEDREIGGLGIYLSRQLLDEMKYHYVNGINVVNCIMGK